MEGSRTGGELEWKIPFSSNEFPGNSVTDGSQIIRCAYRLRVICHSYKDNLRDCKIK